MSVTTRVATVIREHARAGLSGRCKCFEAWTPEHVTERLYTLGLLADGRPPLRPAPADKSWLTEDPEQVPF